MNFKLWLESVQPFLAYHQTSPEAALRIKKNRRFSLKYATQDIIWFTTNIQNLKDDTTGANARGAILKLMVTINKPAGWEEYEKLMLAQLRSQGYDGAILPSGDGFDGFVFDPKQIKILGVVGSDEL